eukprot:Skav209443  [mRNA]  locus=scaffold2199:22889:39278:+ [translate_table: standard]
MHQLSCFNDHRRRFQVTSTARSPALQVLQPRQTHPAEDLCTHFMYGFVFVSAGGANGGYMLKSNDPHADHPSGAEDQDALCPEACYDPNFRPDWNDPDGQRRWCDWPCSPSRTLRGYEALTKGMKSKNPNIKAGEIFSEIAADETKTRRFAANIIEFCEKWGFDGFDLDWATWAVEYPVVAGHNRVDGSEAPEEKHNPSQPLLLTAAVGVGKPTAETAYDIPKMSQYLDLMNLMTYDLHGTWEGYPLSVSWAIDYWLEKAKRHAGSTAKTPAMTTTMSSVPAYGRGWKLKSTSNAGFNAPTDGACAEGATGEEGFRSYYEIRDQISRGTVTQKHDATRVCDYTVPWPDHNNGDWFPGVGEDLADPGIQQLVGNPPQLRVG